MPNGIPYLLVVDAHDGSRSALADLIRERGYPVLEAGRGEDLPADGAALPALVVLDTGPFVTRAIQAVGCMRRNPATAAVPVLMLAPIFCVLERDYALAAGCAACLPKPADLDELLSTIDRLMGRRAVDSAPVGMPALDAVPM